MQLQRYHPISNRKSRKALILVRIAIFNFPLLFSALIAIDEAVNNQLSSRALNSNQLGGKIPASLGNLSKLYWLDVADNQLTGPLPISTENTPGLDKLINTKHL